jgi:hypothetical protein
MPSRYRKKPLAQLEHGTRIYAPSPSEARYRVVANDPVSGERIFAKCRTEEQARSKARELEQVIAQCAPIRDSADAGPRTVERLAHRYIDDHLSGLSGAIPGKADLPAGPVGAAPHRRLEGDRVDLGRLLGRDRRGAPGPLLRCARPRRRRGHEGPGDPCPAAAVVDDAQRGPDVHGPLRQDRLHPRGGFGVRAPLNAAHR